MNIFGLLEKISCIRDQLKETENLEKSELDIKLFELEELCAELNKCYELVNKKNSLFIVNKKLNKRKKIKKNLKENFYQNELKNWFKSNETIAQSSIDVDLKVIFKRNLIF